MQGPVIGVLALQGGAEEHLAALERCAVSTRPIRRPEELAGVHGMVLPGGESTTMSRLLDAFELTEPLRERLAGGMPAFGSCAGMVLLGRDVLDDRVDLPSVRSLGALDVTVRRNAFGRQADSFETYLDVAEITGGPLRAVFIRAPAIDKVSADVSVLATMPDEHAAGGSDTSVQSRAGTIVAVRQGAVLGTAFHPELVRGDQRVHRRFVAIVRGS